MDFKLSVIIIKIFYILDLLLNFLYSNPKKKEVKLHWIWKLRRKNGDMFLLKFSQPIFVKKALGSNWFRQFIFAIPCF